MTLVSRRSRRCGLCACRTLPLRTVQVPIQYTPSAFLFFCLLFRFPHLQMSFAVIQLPTLRHAPPMCKCCPMLSRPVSQTVCTYVSGCIVFCTRFLAYFPTCHQSPSTDGLLFNQAYFYSKPIIVLSSLELCWTDSQIAVCNNWPATHNLPTSLQL